MAKTKKKSEQTRAQAVIRTSGDGKLVKNMPATYRTYRQMRRHPTIALARALTIAPIVAGEWSVECLPGTPPERTNFIESIFAPMREPVLQTALENGCDFGWAPFEKIFDEDDQGRLRLKKLKPLLVDITTILVDEVSGDFLGFRQEAGGSNPITLDLDYALNIPFRVEGSNWYGNNKLENDREPWANWLLASDGANRFDRKSAGSTWVLYYPENERSYDGVDGPLKDNAEIAEAILQSLKSSGLAAIPQRVDSEGNRLWELVALAPPAVQAAFNERFNYLDKLFVRGMLMPERAILEGQFGTKAEAGAHADLAITQCELEHRYVTRHLNWYAVDDLLAYNWGERARGSVRLKAAPLADEKVAYLREVYKSILDSPIDSAAEIEDVDKNALRAAVGVPAQRNVIKPSTVSRIELPAPDSEGAARVGEKIVASFARAISGGGE